MRQTANGKRYPVPFCLCSVGGRAACGAGGVVGIDWLLIDDQYTNGGREVERERERERERESVLLHTNQSNEQMSDAWV